MLSTDEYVKYKDRIPPFNCWWWLRSPGNNSNLAAYVYCVGSAHNIALSVTNRDNAVRPAIKVPTPESQNLEVGDIIFKYNFPFVYLGDNLAISEVPIANRRFDTKSNDYTNSEIRTFLLNWCTLAKRGREANEEYR